MQSWLTHSSTDKCIPVYVKLDEIQRNLLYLCLSFQIWEEYHKQKEVIAAAIPSVVYDVIYSRSLQFPIVSIPNSGLHTGTKELVT
jgi:hypothetical protein